jgi:endonuclease/exonuclease/phosphatase family metal-dependent hydrolase
MLTLLLILFSVPLCAEIPASSLSDTSGVQEHSDSLIIRMMTYNIRYDNPEDGIFAWAKRRDELLSFVLSERLDILCIQEGLHGQVLFLKNGQPGFDFRGVGRDDGKEQGEYSAIFFNAVRFRCLRDGTFWLSPHPEIPGRGWDAALPRIVTWVELRDSVTKKIFFVFNTHFDHQGVRARENSARLIRSKIPAIAGGFPVILAGDFNSRGEELPRKILVAGGEGSPDLADAMDVSREPHQGPVSTYTGFVFKDPEPGNRIDWILVGKAVGVRSHRTLIARSVQGYLSDHLPVVAELILH